MSRSVISKYQIYIEQPNYPPIFQICHNVGSEYFTQKATNMKNN